MGRLRGKPGAMLGSKCCQLDRLGSGDLETCEEVIIVEMEETEWWKSCTSEGGGREGGKVGQGGPGAFGRPFGAMPNDFMPALTKLSIPRGTGSHRGRSLGCLNRGQHNFVRGE